MPDQPIFMAASNIPPVKSGREGYDARWAALCDHLRPGQAVALRGVTMNDISSARKYLVRLRQVIKTDIQAASRKQRGEDGATTYDLYFFRPEPEI